MKKIIVLVVMSLILVSLISSVEQKLIAPSSVYEGNIKVGTSNVRIGEGAEVKGNIFIEEGDLFLASKVSVTGAIKIKKGNIFIKNNFFAGKLITILNGNFTMGKENIIKAGIICKNGIVRFASKNEVHGNVYAMELRQGKDNKIEGKFIKTDK